jgi:ferredoxin-NADP reductase/MOSC domain-containing protein YiiM/ferredoxin
MSNRQPIITVGRLLSVNVGIPREIDWEGRTIRTAVWKDPVLGPRMVRKINIDGDDQADRAGHGGEHRAVFVYQIESYRYWEQELGRDDFSFGQFGENFTVEGLSDEQVCIGDRYRIGEAIFEVTQPRVTCFRVGIRMRNAMMPSLLVAHHRPGFYFRVLTEGPVQAGDEITRIQSGAEQLSVAEIDGLLYLPHRSPRMLERALRIPALSDGWKSSFRSLLGQAQQRGTPPAPAAWPGFRPLRITALTRESSTIRSIELMPVDGPPTGSLTIAGQYLTLRLRPDGPDRPPVIRSYSLSAPAGENGYRISVKREPSGVASSFLHRHARVGDLIDAAAPRGTFTLRDDDRPVVLLSAGVGVTPVLAMLHALVRAPSARPVWWLHGTRNREEHAFDREVEHLLSTLPDAHQLVSYSHPGPGEMPGSTFQFAGRITIETITAAGLPIDADYYLCGPDEFMRSLSAALIARGTAPERIGMEAFGAASVITPGSSRDRHAPQRPAGPAGTGPAVTFSRSNLTVPWDAGFGNLLELAEACHVPASFGCRNGVCHYCETGLLAGQIDYNPAPLDPPAGERVLVCCARPTEPVTLEL